MLLRHTLLYLPAQLLAPLAQFVAAVVWTHWMSPDAYGVLTFLVAAQDLVFVICLSWWSAFCLRYFAGFDQSELDDYRSSEATVLALTVAVGALASLALLAYLRVLGDTDLVVVAVVFLASRSINVHFAERARAQERILDYTVAQVAGPVVGFGLALLGVRFLSATPAVALAGFALAQGAASLWLRRRLNVDLSFGNPDKAMMRRALRYGLPMVIGGALGWIGLNGVRFVVQEMGGDIAMGLLAVGWSLGQRLTGVAAMLVTAAAFPLAVRRLATQSREDGMRQFGAGGTLLFGIIAPAAVGLWQVSPLLVDLTVAAPYRAVTAAILPASVLAGAVRNLRLHFADQSFLLFERTGLGVVIFALEAITVVAFSSVGYAWDGLPGAVDGCLVANIVTAVTAFAVASARFGLLIAVFDWAKILLATAVMCGAVRLTQALQGGEPVRLMLQIAAGAFVYALAIAALFPREARALLASAGVLPPQGVATGAGR